MIYDLIVIGGGACGLSAAITAYQNNKTVLVLEKEKKVGSKILVSGNGKCNLSAIDVCPEKYNDPAFVRPVLSEDPLSFMHEIGIMTKQAGQRIYPYSESALTVVTKMRAALPDDCIKEFGVENISQKNGVFTVGEYKAKNVALCTGSSATKGSDGYFLAEKFGHKTSRLYPSIVPLRSDVTYIKGLSGLRSKAVVRLLQSGKIVAKEEGEILFRDGGISGIAAMCLSTRIARAPGKYDLSVDFVPGRHEDAKDFSEDGKLDGILHKAIAQAVERYAKDKRVPLISALTDFRIENAALGSLTQAQVVCGGLKTSDFDENLQSKRLPGLYAGGEVLDIDGECGGYNIHWAICCGLRIGRSIKN